MEQQVSRLDPVRTRLETGHHVQYAEQGDRSSPAVIFLHGYSDSWFSYSPVLPLLPPSLHALALSGRGHGDSDKPECCYSVDDYAEEVIAFMDALEIDEATLVGHSGGTLIASRVAVTYPQRVTRLVLLGAAIMGARNQTMVEFGEEVHALTDPVPESFVRDFQESTLYQPVPPEFLEEVVRESLKLPANVWRSYLDGVMLGPDHEARINEITAATLLIWGDKDAFFSRAEQERLAAALSDATLKVYPETGHAVHWERPEQVVRDLEAFMEIGLQV